ncbi:multidrug transporter subunit MdtN [Aminobacter sp. HY435]|uniref:multidrug transporter subunit MdtN n=1 Tax=Aminobacter sp. HY435 TaxID=2970917 RepID=UPI0022B98A66|nr:multidrug transporter subunit MdtN [Aminobacter sp. HY435]
MSWGERIRAVIATLLGWSIIAATLVGGYLAYSILENSPRTDVAEIDAPVVQMSPTVPGRIIAFHVVNNQAVKKGEALFEVDPEPYRLRLDQAKAELRATESEVEQGGRNISTEQSNAEVAQKQIERARINSDLAKQTLDRLVPLLPKGYVTAQQVDEARTLYNDSLVSLEQALRQSQGAHQIIGTLETRKAQVEVARAAVALAERDLRNTVVRAPFDGKIVGLTQDVGEYVITAQTVFTLINSNAWEAVAFFRETELGRMKVGDKAQVFAMADPTLAIEGTIEGIGWGVRSDDAVNLLGMPLISKSLNWVRVARRFPVHIRLHNPPDNLMRVGASAAVVVSER